MQRVLSFFVIASLLIFAPSSAFAKGKDIVKINKDIEISKEMSVNDCIAIGGNIIVYGRVENNAIAVGGSIILKPKSYVDGQVVVVGGELARDPDAEIGGRVTQVYMPHFIPSIATLLKGGWLALWATISVLTLLGFLGLAIILVALIPEQIGTAVNALERSFIMMLLWGILWAILILPIALLLAVSIIGIVLIPLEILLAALAFVLGYIAAAIYIGKNILLSFKKFPPPFIDAVLGILILSLIGYLPILGPAIKALFLMAGFGAILTTRFGTVK